MEGFINFLVDNYLIFLLISLVLIFALVGYIAEMRKRELGIIPEKKKKQAEVIDTETLKSSLSGISINDAIGERSLEDKKEKPKEEVLEVDTVPTVKKEEVLEPIVIEEPKEEIKTETKQNI